MRAPESPAPAAVGSRLWAEGCEWKVAALRAPHSEGNETEWWFVLVARPGEPAHPFDWWSERSFLRAFEPVDGG